MTDEIEVTPHDEIYCPLQDPHSIAITFWVTHSGRRGYNVVHFTEDLVSAMGADFAPWLLQCIAARRAQMIAELKEKLAGKEAQ
jgi:hypothetical protein